MKCFGVSVIVAAFVVLLGCRGADSQTSKGPASKEVTPKEQAPKAPEAVDEAKITENLAKLAPEDQKLALSQKYCAIQNEERLGEMAAPVKLELKGQTVFLCCKSCLKTAQDHPDETLAKVASLVAKTKAEKK